MLAAADLPTTLGGWVGVLVGLVVISSVIGGAVITAGKRHIDHRIQREVPALVRTAVETAMTSIDMKLDGIRLNQQTLSEEVAVVRRLEVQIENGLTSRTENIERRQGDLIAKVAEMHGVVMGLGRWDGMERRHEEGT